MKDNKRIIFIALGILIAIVLLVFITLSILNDENKLTVEEKQWINKNISTVQNVNVINDVDIVGKNGTGVFYDFIEKIKSEYNLTINPITYSKTENLNGRSFKIVTDINDNDLVFKEEHFVLVSKSSDNFAIDNSKIGVIANDRNLVGNYINNQSIEFTTYNNDEELYKALDEGSVNYLLIPLDEHLSSIFTKDYIIVKHYSDIKKYFVYEMLDNDPFSSIIKKYFSEYQEKNLDKATNIYTLKTLTTALEINEKELKAIQAEEYYYGFVNNSPYEVLLSGNYGGIVSEYIRRFSEVTNTEFKFTKYKNYETFNNAVNDGKIDIYFNYIDLDNEYNKVTNVLPISFDIITKESDNTVINSIESLRNKEVYVLENSVIDRYLSKYDFINIKIYKNDKELKKLLKDNKIIAIDNRVYNYYANTMFEGYNSKYTKNLDEQYSFKIKENNVFMTLFSKYISTLDSKEIINTGLYNHSVTVKNSTITGQIAKYSLFVITTIIIILLIVYKSTKKIKIVKKIKKEDKLKYIDQLTSIKNRNYLTENISNWNKNTIYPQATIVIDLDSLQNINDTLGYEAGDEQIKAVANILIKTQLDNTDIIRTDGNEFLIYLVGYQEKQVVSYMRKLYKEFKNLPHEHGATMGHSMILDDIKTIEDAFNEAVEEMKNKKEEQ